MQIQRHVYGNNGSSDSMVWIRESFVMHVWRDAVWFRFFYDRRFRDKMNERELMENGHKLEDTDSVALPQTDRKPKNKYRGGT